MMFKFAVPTLQELAYVRFGAALLNSVIPEEGLKTDGNVNEKLKVWNTVRDDAIQILNHVTIPKKLEPHLREVLFELFQQTRKWIEYCQSIDSIITRLPFRENLINTQFWYTSRGEIDKTKMFHNYFETLLDIREESDFDLCDMFVIVCDMCLEEKIISIWNQMSEKQRCKITAQNTESSLLSYWLYYVEPSNHNQLISKSAAWYSSEISLNENYFRYTMDQYNEMASEYFWHKFSEVERKRRARGCATFSIHNGVTYLFCSSLNYMNEQESHRNLRLYNFDVLLSFLDWPYDVFFIDTLKKLRPYIVQFLYNDLLIKILEKMHTNFGTKEKYKEILQEFCADSPQYLKSQMLLHDRNSALVECLKVLQKALPRKSFDEVCSIMKISESDFNHKIPFKEIILANCLIIVLLFYFLIFNLCLSVRCCPPKWHFIYIFCLTFIFVVISVFIIHHEFS